MTTQITIHVDGGNISVDGIPPDWTDHDVCESLHDLVAHTEDAAILTAARAVLATPCIDMLMRCESDGCHHGKSRLYLDN